MIRVLGAKRGRERCVLKCRILERNFLYESIVLESFSVAILVQIRF